MKFKLSFEIEPTDFNLNLDSKVIFLGSCFADNISQKLLQFGLPITPNPFGTIFHPDPIAYHLSMSLKDSEEVSVLQRKDVFLDWMSSGKIAEENRERLESKIIALRKDLLDQLKEAKLLVLSFGTAWGYKRKESKETVGNCHKQPSEEFQKELLDLDKAKDQWGQLLLKLQKFNPDLKVIFTVSPVRHVKDGLVENNRSKARLLELVHFLCDNENVVYFPAYEILIDELRDYRFYSNDLVHPNDTAVEYILERFIPFVYNTDAIKDLERIIAYLKQRDHKSIHPFSEEEQIRKRLVEEKRSSLLSRFPWLRV